MISSAALPIFIFLLAALSIGGLLTAVFYSGVAAGSPLDRKRTAVVAPRQRANLGAPRGGSARKRSVEDTLREVIETQASAAKSRKPTLRVRLRQAGLTWSNRVYYSVCAIVGSISVLLALLIFRIETFSAIAFSATAALLLPHLYVAWKRKSRFKAFTTEFPTAVDLIVRGIKTGLPVVDCFKIAASEVQEPVRGEFKMMVEDQTLGLPIHEAVQRMAERIPIAPARFFAIVIAIQSRTGGNLSEALSNLSKVLRERKKMEAKIRAVSSEAKASAMIIGSLPVIVAGIVYLTSPDYIMLLFSSLQGNLVLACSGLWMLVGVFVMRKMINFEV